MADSVLANLGLSRVAHSLVGDVNTRGVSGGERKRVNIGVELMARPSILFLDEPTSGKQDPFFRELVLVCWTGIEKKGLILMFCCHD